MRAPSGRACRAARAAAGHAAQARPSSRPDLRAGVSSRKPYSRARRSGMAMRALRYRAPGMRKPLIAVTGRLGLPSVIVAITLASLNSGGGNGGNGGSDGSASTDGQPRYAAAANFPKVSGRSMRDLIGNLPQGPVLAPSVTLLQPGQNRF